MRFTFDDVKKLTLGYLAIYGSFMNGGGPPPVFTRPPHQPGSNGAPGAPGAASRADRPPGGAPRAPRGAAANTSRSRPG